MVLVVCKDCKKEISTDAKKCPHCGAKAPSGAPGCLAICLWLFVGLPLGLTLLALGIANAPSAKPKDPADYVLSTCREFIRDSLHDASSAEFDRVYPDAVPLPDNQFRVVLPLRAKNGFGAIRHFAVECVVEHSGDSFRLVKLREIR